MFRFIYYFLNQRSEEFEVLSQALKGDTLNLGRLNHLQTKLRREAVSLNRITTCIEDSIPIVRELFKDFIKYVVVHLNLNYSRVIRFTDAVTRNLSTTKNLRP